MNPVPLFLIIVTLPLLLGGCGEKEVNEEKIEVREGISYLKGSDTPDTGKTYTLDQNPDKNKKITPFDIGYFFFFLIIFVQFYMMIKRRWWGSGNSSSGSDSECSSGCGGGCGGGE